MKKLVVLGALLSIWSGITVANKGHYEAKQRCCEPIVLRQKDFDHTQGVFTISESGSYILGEDIKGQLVVAADDVYVNLCHKRIKTNSQTNATIRANNHVNLQVENGCIENKLGRGIYATNYKDIALHNLSFSPVNQAIVIEDSNNGVLHDILVTDNTTTIGGMIVINANEDTSNNFSLTDVDISHTSTNRTDDEFFGLLDVTATSNVTLTRVSVNNNISKDMQSFVAFNAIDSDNLVVLDSEFNFNESTKNVVPGGSTIAAALLSSNNCVLRNCRFNDTKGTGLMSLAGLVCGNVTNLVIDSCQANNSFVSKAEGTTATINVVGMFLSGSSLQLTNSQAHSTLIEAKDPMGQYFSSGFLIITARDAIISQCQSHDVSLIGVDKLNATSYTTGIAMLEGSHIEVNAIEVQNTYSDGAFAYGVLAVGGTDVEISDSIANNVGASTLGVGFASTGLNDWTIGGSLSYGNDYGIAFEQSLHGTVSDSQIYDNGVGIWSGTYLLGGSSNPINETIDLSNNTLLGNDEGIVIDQATSQVGVDVRDNVVLGSTHSGFKQIGYNFSGDFEGNFAANNHPDYNVDKCIQLHLFTDEAEYKSKSGDDRLVEFTNVSLCKKKHKHN